METLTVKLASIKEDPNFAVDVLEYEDTSEQRQLSGETPKFVWACETDTLNTAEKDTLRTFYLARKGAYQAFYWTNPIDSTQYTVRFVPKTFKVQDQGTVNWKISFSLSRII